MAILEPAVGHLLRRAGFGATEQEAEAWNRLGVRAAIDKLVDYELTPNPVDDGIGGTARLGITSNGPFNPNNEIVDARQRWLFRMVYTEHPLQEKMALFWHDHFATGYGKLTGQLGGEGATRALAQVPAEYTDRTQREGVAVVPRGQLELFRDLALGNYRDLLLAVSQDVAMVAWLDGDTNTQYFPQENFARELMELFSIGVDHFTEEDVYAGARVFTGWNLKRHDLARGNDQRSDFYWSPDRHDDGPKTFSFAIYPDGSRTIPARSATAGFQDGVDLINALAGHPETGPFLCRKLYTFFVNDAGPVDERVVQRLARTYYATGFNMREVVRELFQSQEFQDPANYWARYSWPVEYVVRMFKEVGCAGFSANQALSPLANMGQTLFEPPDVAGWSTGSAWMSTATMLARMNFASSVSENQRFALRTDAMAQGTSSEAVLEYFLGRMTMPPLDLDTRQSLLNYLNTDEQYVGSRIQAWFKGAGIAHLIAACPEYQFV